VADLNAGRKAAIAVRDFNKQHPVGTPVRYTSDFTQANQPLTTRTRSSAQILASGKPVIWIEGVAGCVALSHIEAVPASAPYLCKCPAGLCRCEHATCGEQRG
jgi:hypothetical protein